MISKHAEEASQKLWSSSFNTVGNTVMVIQQAIDAATAELNEQWRTKWRATCDTLGNSMEREHEHRQKWNEILEMLRELHPTSSVTLWVEGYVHGLEPKEENKKDKRIAELEVEVIRLNELDAINGRYITERDERIQGHMMTIRVLGERIEAMAKLLDCAEHEWYDGAEKCHPDCSRCAWEKLKAK